MCFLLPQPKSTRFHASSILSGCLMFSLMMLLRFSPASAASPHAAIKPITLDLLVALARRLVGFNAVVSSATTQPSHLSLITSGGSSSP
jgi:hypothetical protein